MAVQTCCFFFIFVLSFFVNNNYTHLGRWPDRIAIESLSWWQFALFARWSPLNVSCLLLCFSRCSRDSFHVLRVEVTRHGTASSSEIRVVWNPLFHSISPTRSLDRFLARFLLIDGWNRALRRLLIQWPLPPDMGQLSCTDALGKVWSRSWWYT